MLILALRVVRGIRIEVGRILTPSGEVIKGFKVSIGGQQEEPERSYDDIESIFKSNEASYKTFEEHTPQGTFKSYVVIT